MAKMGPVQTPASTADTWTSASVLSSARMVSIATLAYCINHVTWLYAIGHCLHDYTGSIGTALRGACKCAQAQYEQHEALLRRRPIQRVVGVV